MILHKFWSALVAQINKVANFFWTAPEVRVGFPIGQHIELSAGIEALLLVSFSPPRWQKDTEDNVYIYAGSRGAAQFPADEIIGRRRAGAGEHRSARVRECRRAGACMYLLP